MTGSKPDLTLRLTYPRPTTCPGAFNPPRSSWTRSSAATTTRLPARSPAPRRPLRRRLLEVPGGDGVAEPLRLLLRPPPPSTSALRGPMARLQRRGAQRHAGPAGPAGARAFRGHCDHRRGPAPRRERAALPSRAGRPCDARVASRTAATSARRQRPSPWMLHSRTRTTEPQGPSESSRMRTFFECI